MESGRGYARFFLQHAPKIISAVLGYARKRYPDLFNGIKSNRRSTPQASFRYLVGKSINDRYDQLCRLADYEPAKINELAAVPILDYYMILNSRVQAALKSKTK